MVWVCIKIKFEGHNKQITKNSFLYFFKIELFIKIYNLSTNGRYSDLEAEKLVYKLSWRVPGEA